MGFFINITYHTKYASDSIYSKTKKALPNRKSSSPDSTTNPYHV